MKASSLLVVALCLSPALAAQDELTVLPASPPPRGMMETLLARQAADALARRLAEYEKVQTPEDVAAWQNRLHRTFLDKLDLPAERTPLNPQVVAKVDRGDYRIEKVIFESQPKHFVTAILYLPKTDPPYPGVLVPCGHSANGKAIGAYQLASILLARSGCAALCYDPIGQGERHQVLKPDGKALMGTTTEHQAHSAACVLLGRNVATYRIWDGMRAMDYLASRSEVDAKHLGCTGNSGGGTLTSYLMALDERILAAAPSCYLTTFEKVLEKIGPQDAEQIIHAQLALGMDHADYVLMRAPRPTLILSATKDFFDIGGTWETFRQAKRFYGRLGFPERVDLLEADEKHGFNRPQREGAARWMRRWLMGKDDVVVEPETAVMTDAEAQVAPKGEVMLLEGARSVTDLNVERMGQLQKLQDELWKDRAKALAEVRKVAGIRPLGELGQPKETSAGKVIRDGYMIEKLILDVEEGVRLPALAFVPAKPTGQATLWLDGAGKASQAAAGGAIEKLVQAGQVVLAVDIRGVGETAGKARHAHFNRLCGEDWSDVSVAYLLGRSLVGMRAEDVLVGGRFLTAYGAWQKPNALHLLAAGCTGVAALHAAALEPQLFASVTIRDSLASFADVVRGGVYMADQYPQMIHGALKVYDLPRLAETLGDKLKIERPLRFPREDKPKAQPKAKK
ncbi:MAG: Acetyl xylan esterase (AXE1) [Planctomycetes bacterium ADurb.Bin126]|nr:MAG: Acetyl xylan esterase (AXE1) [Planctomycetes bacterium ADurb.Bin126]HOD84487.1 acetylxylan esterase [Phycisphaerae bacterium]HQL74208.1 acetylxylan esterase [Phycisphaerae bacterium]